jgi:hypothetical protein
MASLCRMYEKRFVRAAFCYGLLFSPALYYTWKIDQMDGAQTLARAGHALLTGGDLGWILLIFLACLLVMPPFFWSFSDGWWSFKKKLFPLSLKEGTLLLSLLWIPFLLAFYPAPGMNDTVYMMENPWTGSIQFPWFYSAVYGLAAEGAERLLGTREYGVFALSCIQMVGMAAVWTWVSRWISHRGTCTPLGLLFYAYGALFPMVGNYAIAAVRDTVYSMTLLLWMIYLYELAHEKQNRTGWAFHWLTLPLLVLGLVLSRSNGLPAAIPLILAAGILGCGKRRAVLALILGAAVTIIPSQVIYHVKDEEPLVQESLAVPINQMGRVLVMDGHLSPEARKEMTVLLPEKDWRENYNPYTVDFIKWHDQFQHDTMNEHKKAFLAAWWKTGWNNPEMYVEAWMTETYSIWNLDPLEYHVQSRFGWALSDENTKDMAPADNDLMAVGSFPMPMKLKSALANWQYEGSRFLGPGLCLWFCLLILALYYVRKETWKGWAVLPVLINAGTLLLSTPASAVFRYSFLMVPALPLLIMMTGMRETENEQK